MPEIPSPQSSPQRAWPVDAVVLGAIFVAMFYGIGRYGLYEPHEGHFAGVGFSMVTNHDWVTPRLNGGPYLNKPPLFYWMIASSYTLFGVSEWGARLPQALIGWLGVLLAWRWARELFGPRAGRVAAGMLAVSAGWYLFSHQLLIDELLSVIYLASLYCIWRIVENPERLKPWFWFYVLIGLSIMAKGLVGPALAFTVLLCVVWLRKLKGVFSRGRPWLGVCVVLAIVLPWLVLIELRNPGFLEYVIVNEHIKRIFDKRDPPDYEPVKKGIFEYLLISLIWLAPWCFFLPQIARFCWRRLNSTENREPLPPHPGPFPRRGDGERRSLAMAVLGVGALIPTLIFVPVPSRLIYYSLPTLPPFALLASGWWMSLSEENRGRERTVAAVIALVLGAGALVAGAIVVPYLVNIPELAAAPQTLDYIPGFAFAIGLGFITCGAMLLQRRPGMAMFLFCACLLTGEAYNTRGFAEFDRVRSSRRLVQFLLPRAGPDTVWISEGSLEIGAAGGMAFNLGLDGKGKPRFVYVMSDSPKRSPPHFPGKPPEYLIDKAKLTEIWNSNRPALYVTDFQRMGADDSLNLPLGPIIEIKVDGAGMRRIFVNEAGRARFKL